jgi:hypothetical protein
MMIRFNRLTGVLPVVALSVVLMGVTEQAAAQETWVSRVSLSVQGSLFQPAASGSVFDLARTELTLDQGDFRVLRVGAEATVRVHPKVSLVGGWSTGETEVSSGIRRTSVYGTGTQTTVLSLDPALRGGLLVELGRFGAEGEWTVATLVGVGRQGYQFTQTGVFPDASTPGSTFSADLASEGTGDLYFGELRLTRTLTDRLGVLVSLGYQSSEARVGGDYVGFDPISLSGLGISTGLTVRF